MMRVVESTGRPFNGSDTYSTSWKGYYDPRGNSVRIIRDGQLPNYDGTWGSPAAWWGIYPPPLTYPYPDSEGSWISTKGSGFGAVDKSSRDKDSDLSSNPTARGLESKRELDKKRESNEKWSEEIEKNEKAWGEMGTTTLQNQYGDLASLFFVMREGKIVGTFESFGESLRFGQRMYGKLDAPYFSIHSISEQITLM